jgi:DNA-binding LacI/PurR family transcriptional regulator
MATISDVAKRAGVSVATVSRVINGVASVQSASVEAVNRAIAEMEYRPNSIGRNLRRAETKRIIVLQPSIANPFFSRVVRGIEGEARESGYQIMLCDTDNDQAREQMYLDMLDCRVADGAIFITSCKEPSAYSAIAQRHPVIHCCEFYDDDTLSSVTMDNVAAAKTAIAYLIGQGHRRIGFLSAYNKFLTVGQRYRGYLEAHADAGIEVDRSLNQETGPIHDDQIWDQTQKYAAAFARMDNRPTAIFCSSDMVAIAAIHALKAEGLRVPEDISVMGFDDIEMARLFDPGITTINIPKHAIGREAFRLLLKRLEQPDTPAERIIQDHSVVVRSSTAPYVKR